MGAAVTFPGVWALQGINVARQSILRSTGDAAVGTIGVDGDGVSTTTMPAGWVANATVGAALIGTPGGDQTIIGAANANARAALLATRTRVSYVFTTNPTIGGGATGCCDWLFVKTAAAPFQITCTAVGTAVAGGAIVDAEVYVQYLWSASSGR